MANAMVFNGPKVAADIFKKVLKNAELPETFEFDVRGGKITKKAFLTLHPGIRSNGETGRYFAAIAALTGEELNSCIKAANEFTGYVPAKKAAPAKKALAEIPGLVMPGSAGKSKKGKKGKKVAPAVNHEIVRDVPPTPIPVEPQNVVVELNVPYFMNVNGKTFEAMNVADARTKSGFRVVIPALES